VCCLEEPCAAEVPGAVQDVELTQLRRDDPHHGEPELTDVRRRDVDCVRGDATTEKARDERIDLLVGRRSLEAGHVVDTGSLGGSVEEACKLGVVPARVEQHVVVERLDGVRRARRPIRMQNRLDDQPAPDTEALGERLEPGIPWTCCASGPDREGGPGGGGSAKHADRNGDVEEPAAVEHGVRQPGDSEIPTFELLHRGVAAPVEQRQ